MLYSRGERRVKVAEGPNITVKEASEIMGVSGAVGQTMFSKGYETLEQMKQYRKDIETGVVHRGGRAPTYYDTSEGRMTLNECVEHHPHDIAKVTIRHRGESWGFDHKCLWMPKVGLGFKAAAIALDGEPRPHKKEVTTVSKCKITPIDRLKACHREKGQIRCKHYGNRLKMDDGVPEECLVAVGGTCSNFEGQPLKVYTNSSGRGARRYNANGTTSEAR